MNQEKIQALDKLKEDINAFLKLFDQTRYNIKFVKQRTGDQKVHQSILEHLGLDGNDVNYSIVERLFEFLDYVGDINAQIFIANGIKQIVKMNYSIFSTEEKKNIYQKAFEIYRKMPSNSFFMQDLIINIFKFFYESIQVEVSFIEDVKGFCESSVEHLQLGLQLFSNIINCMQDYQIKYKCSNDMAYIDYNSDLSQFHRKKEISFRQNLLPQIFDIPFQLLNTKREDLMSEQETNFSVLLEVLNLLYQCLNYDYFDQKKVTDEKFVVESSILSIPCREKKQDNGYINDLKSQEFTSTLFELYYYMVNKHKEISIKCLQIISLLCRLSIKFFKKEDQKFSQMIFIIDGLQKIMQTHAFIFQESDVFEQTEEIFHAFCFCVSKIPIGISFSDGESLQGFWEFVVEVQNITKVAIQRRNIPCIELLLEFWCGYDYFLGHDGAQKQEQLRGLVEKILKQFIKTSNEMIVNISNDEEFEEVIETHALVIKYFGQLSNTWIDSIEEILMKKIGDVFQQRSQSLNLVIKKLNNINNNKKNNDFNNQQYYQLYWLLLLLYKSQSYNIKEELQTTNKHYELDSRDEIKEDLDILHQAFESFGKQFQIALNLFKSQDIDPLPHFLLDLILEILQFLIDYILAYKNHINFDYLCIIIKFTDSLELKNYFYLNYVISYFLDQLCFSSNQQNASYFISILKSIASNLKATDQGVQIGCFPFDLQGFFESDTFKRHKDSSYDSFDGKQIQKIYQFLFLVVDRHEQYKKIVLESDFQRIEEQLSQQRIDLNEQKKLSTNSNKENVKQKTKLQYDEHPISSSSSPSCKKLNSSKTKEKAIAHNDMEDDIVEIVPSSSLKPSNMNSQRNSQEKKRSVKPYSQSSKNNMIDYFNIFMNVISSRIQLDEQIPISEQKKILRIVLNQLVGIVKSSTMHTYTRLVQFILSNNIFYSIKQVIKQVDELNAEEINCSLKFISELAQTRIYLTPDIQELLLKEVVEIIISTQSRLLNKQFLQNVKNDSDEWNLIILPLSYQYRIIFNLLSQQMLNFSQLDSQMIISNMFHCLTVITPEKMSQYHKKLYWIYRSIHLLSQLHFEVFLFLQPLEFHSVTQIMEEALKVSFDSEEPMEFFINVLNQIFICKKSNNLIMNQYLAYSEETLIKVLQAIVLKVIRNEDLNQKNLYRLMLGYFWMLEKEKFLFTINQVFNNFPHQNLDYINKFQHYSEEIEILDLKKYQYIDQMVLLDSKIIFKKIFG